MATIQTVMQCILPVTEDAVRNYAHLFFGPLNPIQRQAYLQPGSPVLRIQSSAQTEMVLSAYVV